MKHYSSMNHFNSPILDHNVGDYDDVDSDIQEILQQG